MRSVLHAVPQVTGIVVSDRAGTNSDNDNVLKDGIHFGVREHLDNANQVRAWVTGPCPMYSEASLMYNGIKPTLRPAQVLPGARQSHRTAISNTKLGAS